MRSLVFGGTGRLGKAVCERLKARGDEVLSFGHSVYEVPENVDYAIFCQRNRLQMMGEYHASVEFTHNALERIRWTDRAAAVIVASVAVGINDDRHDIDYQCGKAAAIQLMRHYSTVLRCNAVSPWAFTGPEPKVAMSEVVEVIEFLASPSSKGINGQNIIVDRGLQHRWN